MNHLLRLLFAVFLIGAAPAHAAISKIIQGQIDCRTACNPILPFFELLCSGNCASYMSTNDGTTFYGADGTVGRRSLDGGFTWTDFVTFPTGRTYSGNPPAIGLAANGSVLYAKGTIAPAGCAIYRSTDGTNTWTEVFFSSGGFQCDGSAVTTILRCSADGHCILPYVDFGADGQMLESTTNGDSWFLSTGFTFTTGSPVSASYWDGTNGIVAFNEDVAGIPNMLWTTSGGGIGGWTYSPQVDAGACKAIGSNTNFRSVMAACNFPNIEFANVDTLLDFITISTTNMNGNAHQMAVFGGTQYLAGNITAGTCAFFRNGGGASTTFTQVPSCNTASISFFDRGDMIVRGAFIYGTSGGQNADARVYRLRP